MKPEFQVTTHPEADGAHKMLAYGLGLLADQAEAARQSGEPMDPDAVLTLVRKVSDGAAILVGYRPEKAPAPEPPSLAAH